MITPPATLGLLGGGQLGRYFVLAARQAGYAVMVLDPDRASPGGALADRHLVADFDDDAALDELADACAVVTAEFENIPAASLERVASRGCLRPGVRALTIAQDRLAEKHFLGEAGVAVAPWCAIPAGQPPAEPASGPHPDLGPGFPAVLKTARLGYDGKGQVRLAAAEDLAAAHAELGRVDCVLEERVDLAREVSVLVARSPDGHSEVFPVAENLHRAGVLHRTRVPARLSPALDTQAREVALRIAEQLDYCGVLAVEFFVTTGGELLVNEIAPRPHNSGHYTLDACSVSQFEQQLRAVCGLALAPARVTAPVTMVNLLGELWPSAGAPDWSGLLGEGRARLHLYGKAAARPGRKMGHVNVVGLPGEADADAVSEIAETLWQNLAGEPSQ